MFLSHRLQNQADCNNILYLLSWIYFVFLWKFQCWKSETQENLLIGFDFTYWKRCNFWLWNHGIANLIRKTCTKPYQNRPRFVEDMTKTFWCVFRFTVLTAVHSQNAKARFHKVVWRHYLGEAGDVYINCTTNLLSKLCTKFNHSRSGFVDCISKNILVFVVFTV